MSVCAHAHTFILNKTLKNMCLLTGYVPDGFYIEVKLYLLSRKSWIISAKLLIIY